MLGPLEIDHILPVARGGGDDEANLWLSCRLCNSTKSSRSHARDPVTGRSVRLFNPRRQTWSRHFTWSPDGSHIVGHTACGRATVIALRLNQPLAILVRREWIKAGWHPPSD